MSVSPTYPRRPSHFAHKFCRLMGKVCLANELGADACWLLCVIAMTEDAKGYRDPVSFFNEQLFPIAGLGSVSSLMRLRSKCEAAGWLVHIPGTNRKAARYWVSIPDRFAGIDDAPSDENPADYRSVNSHFDGQIDDRSDERSGSEAVTKRYRSEQRSGDEANNYPPIPTPIPENPPTPLTGGENFNAPLYAAIAEACEKDPVANRSVLWGPYEALAGALPPFTPEEVEAFKLDFWRYVPKAKEKGRSVPYPNELKNNLVAVRVAARKAAKRLASKPKIDSGPKPKTFAEQFAEMTIDQLQNERSIAVAADRKHRVTGIDEELKRRDSG